MASVLYWLFLLLFTAYMKEGLPQNDYIILSSSKESVVENNTVALTCSNKSGTLLESRWTTWLNERKQAVCGLKENVCVKTNFLYNNTVNDCICNDNGSFTVVLKHVDRYQHGTTWKCECQTIESNELVINVSVPVTHAILNQSGNEPVYEHSNVTFTCTSSYSLPSAKINWFLSYSSSTVEITESQDVTFERETHPRDDNVISVMETLFFSVNKTMNDWSVYCTASNLQSDVVVSGKIKLSVIYPPDRSPVIDGLSNGSIYKVIENDKASLSCSVKGGNPLSNLEWYCEEMNNITSYERITDNETVTSYLSWTASRTNGKTCICQMVHVLSNISIYVRIEVLYPPGESNIYLEHLLERTNVTLDSKLIEYKSYRLLCIADSNPPVEYIWDGPKAMGISHNTTVDLSDIKRNESGTYTCHARNIMHPTFGEIKRENNSIIVKIDILFNPTLAEINRQDVAEGSVLNITCEAISANSSDTNFTWTRDTSDFKLSSNELFIKNVSRHDSMNYTCTAKAFMEPTVGESEVLFSTETFFLNVWYRADVKMFVVNGHESDSVVLKNESNMISFTCEIDSNPNSTVKIITPNGTEVIFIGTNMIEYDYFLSSCVDNGTFTCSGSNVYNYGHPGVAQLSVCVYCTPLAFHHIDKYIRSKHYDPVTFRFRAVAYPEPVFTWEQWTNSSWRKITNNNLFSISSKKLQSNLTVNNFTTTTAHGFRLVVENEMGTLIQHYTLEPFERPKTPTEFRQIKELLTDTSVTLIWKTGSNGGIPQTFVIAYGKEEDQDWRKVTLQDTGEFLMNSTIRGLSSNTIYEIKLSAVNSEGSSDNVTLQIETKGIAAKDVPTKGSITAFVAGSISGGVVVVILMAVICMCLYKKRSASGKESERSELLYENVPIADKRPKKRLSHRFSFNQETSFQTLQELDDVPPCYEQPTECFISHSKIEQIGKIRISELLPYVLRSTEEIFRTEYQKLPNGLQKPCVYARKPENIALNRYNGIYPYDHSRVKISEQPEFYINASYINGYSKENEYIASLGPTRKVTCDFQKFWMMVWNEQSDVIVMLANFRETSGMKCEQYWPELGTTATYGDIQVTFEEKNVFAEYTTRSFFIINAEERRSVTHLHYTAWPDKMAPEDVTTLIEFRERLKMIHSARKGPIIVHGSAGIGRTGTLIALDRLIQEGQCESSVDVFRCVSSMREQRLKMVRTLEQYIYIYKALVYSLCFDSEVIPVERFVEYVDQANDTIYTKLFQQLQDSVEPCCKEESDAHARYIMLVDKNRKDADITDSKNRVLLYENGNSVMSDYIDAVYVNSFKKKDHFILAQSPLPGTVSEFVGMIYRENCCCVVTMDDIDESGIQQSVSQYLPTDGQVQRFGDIQIACFTLESKPQYTVKEIKMQKRDLFESREKVAYHFQYTKWVQQNDTPDDTEEFVKFVKTVEEYADQIGEEGSRVLVHCLKANERCALYSVVAILTEKIKYERQVSVLNTVRHLRTRRRTAITSMGQLQFCYQAVKAYINLFES